MRLCKSVFGFLSLTLIAAYVGADTVTTTNKVFGLVGAVTDVTFMPDDSAVLMGGYAGGAALVNPSTGADIKQFFGHEDAVNGIAVSPDGSKIVTVSGVDGFRSVEENSAKVWDAASGALLRTITGHSEFLTAVAFSPDGSKIATGSGDYTARIWNVNTGALLQTLNDHTERVTDVVFSIDGTKVVTSSFDATAKIWNVSTGALLHTLTDGGGFVHAVAVSPGGGEVLTAGTLTRRWNINSGTQLGAIFNSTNDVFYSSDGTKVLVAAGSTAKLIDATTGVEIRTFDHGANFEAYDEFRSAKVTAVSMSSDGTQVVTAALESGYTESANGSVIVWDASNGSVIQELTGPRGNANAFAFSPDGSRIIVSAKDAEQAVIYDASNGSIQHVLSVQDTVNAVAFTPDGTGVLTGADRLAGNNRLVLWSASTGAQIRSYDLVNSSRSVESLAISPDGTKILVGVNFDDKGLLFDIASGTLLQELSGHTSCCIRGVGFLGDNSQAYTTSFDNTIRVWDVATGAQVRTIFAANDSGAAFSSDGTRAVLASGNPGVATLINLVTGVEIRTFAGHSGAITSVAISPDKTRVLTGGGTNDFKMKLWDASTGAELRTYSGISQAVDSVGFHPNGTQVLAGSNAAIRVWPISGSEGEGEGEGEGTEEGEGEGTEEGEGEGNEEGEGEGEANTNVIVVTQGGFLIEEGEKVVLNGPLGYTNYQWFRDNVPVSEAPPRVTGSQTATLTFDPVLESDSGIYTLQYEDGSKVIQTTDPFVLAILPPNSLPLLNGISFIVLVGMIIAVWLVLRGRIRNQSYAQRD